MARIYRANRTKPRRVADRGEPPAGLFGKNAMPRPGRPEITPATRQALFVLASAADAGFQFRAAAEGRLEILGPVGVDPAACQPVIAAIRAHGSEI